MFFLVVKFLALQAVMTVQLSVEQAALLLPLLRQVAQPPSIKDTETVAPTPRAYETTAMFAKKRKNTKATDEQKFLLVSP